MIIEVTKAYFIEYYEKQKGEISSKKWFDDWKNSLDYSFKRTINRRMTRIMSGNLGDKAFVGNGVWEIKFDEGIRIYYSKIKEDTLLFLHAGDKNTQQKDIEIAKSNLIKYKGKENAKMRVHRKLNERVTQ